MATNVDTPSIESPALYSKLRDIDKLEVVCILWRIRSHGHIRLLECIRHSEREAHTPHIVHLLERSLVWTDGTVYNIWIYA